MSAPPQLLIAHPGRQHSHQLAYALSQAGMLERYWTGVPVTDGPGTRPFARFMSQFSSSDLMPIPEEQVSHCFIGSLGRKLPKYVLPKAQALWWGWKANRIFDRWIARRLRHFPQADAVICYETSALETFQEARRLGMTAILDAASFHHVQQDHHYAPAESEPTHRSIIDQKDAEIALADHILTVSELAREGYVDAGVVPEKVSAIPVGCDLSRFSPAKEGAGRGTRRHKTQVKDAGTPTLVSEATASDLFTFVFAGYASQRKGTDVLLEAAGQLRSRDVPCQIVCAGGAEDQHPWKKHSNVKRLGRLPQAELASLFQGGDCLVLPSRHDSFGMVVVEAMATGLPVLLSDQVGSKEVMQEGKTGWTVPVGDAEALAERMTWCVEHRGELNNVRGEAREAARAYSWEAYHQRVVERLQHIIRGVGKTSASSLRRQIDKVQ